MGSLLRFLAAISLLLLLGRALLPVPNHCHPWIWVKGQVCFTSHWHQSTQSPWAQRDKSRLYNQTEGKIKAATQISCAIQKVAQESHRNADRITQMYPETHCFAKLMRVIILLTTIWILRGSPKKRSRYVPISYASVHMKNDLIIPAELSGPGRMKKIALAPDTLQGRHQHQ